MCKMIPRLRSWDLLMSKSNIGRIMRIAFMSGALAKPPQSGFPRIYDVFDDHLEFWSGYPSTKSAIEYRPTLYLRERCRLAEIFERVHTLILTTGKKSDATVQGFTSAVEDISAEMRHWYERLPFELQYRWPMCISIWELRSVYCTSLLQPRPSC